MMLPYGRPLPARLMRPRPLYKLARESKELV